jgi:hypothetical protein
VAASYPPRFPIEHQQAADRMLTAFEDAFILSKVMHEPKLAAELLMQCRSHVELPFSPR